MAKALFHKSQRVFVKPVGTWALIERVIPHWVKDVQEPLRVTYDCGLGREFLASELVSESTMNRNDNAEAQDHTLLEHWRVFRMRSKWQAAADTGKHPYPGTFPVVMTDDTDWGGWRVPGAEYDRDPQRIEHQARMIAAAPDMMRLIKRFAELAAEKSEEIPVEVVEEMQRCSSVLRQIFELDGPTTAPVTVAAE